MKRRINILLQMNSRHHRESLAALLTAEPGIQVIKYRYPMPFTLPAQDSDRPDILLLESSTTTSLDAQAIQDVRRIWPGLKTVLLVDSLKQRPPFPNSLVDLVLPVNTTAGDLLYSLNHLVSSSN